jgi:hypothetical protein
MEARLKLKPGQKGTKKLVEKYGDSLICVRYRYDETSCTRVKTVELVVETKDWTPPPLKFAPHELVPVRIAYTENTLKQMAKAAGGRWNPTAKLWFIPYGNIRSTILEKHLVLDAKDKCQKQ